ncbi:MAG: RDD family protein [Salinivirgaceae bacterium]
MKLKRFVKFFVDSFLIGVLTMLCGGWIIEFINVSFFRIILVVYYFVFFLYYFLSETLSNRTVGKKITGTMVKISSNKKVKMVFLRTICRLIPFEPLSILFDENDEMWHDKLSKTTVIIKTKKNKNQCKNKPY